MNEWLAVERYENWCADLKKLGFELRNSKLILPTNNGHLPKRLVVPQMLLG